MAVAVTLQMLGVLLLLLGKEIMVDLVHQMLALMLLLVVEVVELEVQELML